MGQVCVCSAFSVGIPRGNYRVGFCFFVFFLRGREGEGVDIFMNCTCLDDTHAPLVPPCIEEGHLASLDAER